MHRKLGFIWKTYAQPAIGVIVMLPGWGPRACAQSKAIEGQQISKFTLLGLNSWTALLLNLPESKLTRDCVSRIVCVPGGGVGQGVGVWNWMLLTLSVKDNRKKNKVSAKFKSRPREILLGNFLATCTVLRYFFDSEQLFGEWATLKFSTFLAYFHYF